MSANEEPTASAPPQPKQEENPITMNENESVGIESAAPSNTNESESAVQSSDARVAGQVPNESAPTSSVPQIDSDSDEGIGDYLDEPEISVTAIKETVRMVEPPQSSTNHRNLMDELELEDEQDTDTLSPLMMDNHCYTEHFEILKHTNFELLDVDRIDNDFHLHGSETEEEDNTVRPSSSMKHSDTKDSISSIDSDLSLGYDHNKLIIQPVDQKAKQEAFEYHQTSSSDDNKDSGCEANKKHSTSDEEQQAIEDLPMEIPDDDFCEKIVEQVEFYFSDDSLLKDAFLLKHVRRNKEGFVSLKLVSSFKRVRQLTKDWRVVGYAVKKCGKVIELNDIETKIRRVEPLPLYDETTPSRTVVATNLPFDKLTIEKVSDIFSKCGEIALVRILRPDCPIPADVRQFVNKHPELQQNECALVEFTESSAARRAQNVDGIVVFELILPKKKTGKKATNMTKMIEGFKYTGDSEIERSRGGEALENRYKFKRNNSVHYERPEQMVYQHPVRKMSQGNENFNTNNYNPHINAYPQYYEIPPRRMSNCEENSRKYSSVSDYSNCSEMSRRPSDVQRRLSNCQDMIPHELPQSRRGSLSCSDHCPCSRRNSAFSNDGYRRISHSSMGDYGTRKYSSSGSSYSSGSDRRYSTASSTLSDGRRVSFDQGNDRKISTGSMTYNDSPIRKYSANGFDPMARKISSTEYYFVNGRKISTDSGYDRRMSVGSNYDSDSGPITRSRNNSFICNNHVDNLVRKPMGPAEDGSKGFGFGARTRKVGDTKGTVAV